MTALAAPASGSRYLPAVSCGVDRAIRVSTAAVVLAVAGIAAYISYWHAYAVVREYGESGVTALLEPATIDGLVYASSMVILYAARHRLPVPRLARWMLALGVAASLAVNVAQGWSHGLVGAVVAAWPAVALVGSYELLAWMIRTAARRTGPRTSSGPTVPQPDQPATGLRPAARPGARGRASDRAWARYRPGIPRRATARFPWTARSPGYADQARSEPDQADQVGGPVRNAPDRGGPRGSGSLAPVSAVRRGQIDIDAAAVAAYRASVREGRPLSERKLAEAFGRTSRRWARNRMAEVRQSPVPA